MLCGAGGLDAELVGLAYRLLPRFQRSADQEPLHVVPAFTVTFKSGHGGLLWLELSAEPPPGLRRHLCVPLVDQPDRFGPAGVAGDQGGFLADGEGGEVADGQHALAVHLGARLAQGLRDRDQNDRNRLRAPRQCQRAKQTARRQEWAHRRRAR